MAKKLITEEDDVEDLATRLNTVSERWKYIDNKRVSIEFEIALSSSNGYGKMIL